MIYLGTVGGISALKSRGIQVYFVFAVYNRGGWLVGGSSSGDKSTVVSDPTLTSTAKQEKVMKPQLPGDISDLMGRIEFFP